MCDQYSLLKSVSRNLASTYRETGPRLISEHVDTSVGGSTNPISDAGNKIIKIYHNLTSARYYEFAVEEDGTTITNTGALVSKSGAKTGRCPKDKRIVFDTNSDTCQKIWWNDNNTSPNYKMDPKSFLINRETAINYLNHQNKLFVVDAFAGWDKEHRIKVRLIAERAYHAFFLSNMLVKPTEEELVNFGEPDFVIFNAGKFPSNRYSSDMTSSTSIAFSMERREIVILGTQYAGEMKKGIFSVMYYLMAQKNILTLHSSANISLDGSNVSLFFGLSGTGKTTLSADPNRMLVGDDEHCWTDNGLFNIEGGCYAKCINLSQESEPDIFNAIRFGSLLENVAVDPDSRHVNYNDTSITVNTRASYPIHHISNAVIPCLSGHPNNIIFLTFDAFGVIPLVSKLNMNQAMYHFISGYTAKIAGTEDGVNQPEATFSACFGEPFLMCHPFTYAKMLSEKINQHQTNVWLINTGWVLGKYGDEGTRRCPLSLTRQIVSDIQSNKMAMCWENKDNISVLPVFQFEYLAKYYETEHHKYLDPMEGWTNKDNYILELNKLSDLFQVNFQKYVGYQQKDFSKEDIEQIQLGGPLK